MYIGTYTRLSLRMALLLALLRGLQRVCRGADWMMTILDKAGFGNMVLTMSRFSS